MPTLRETFVSAGEKGSLGMRRRIRAERRRRLEQAVAKGDQFGKQLGALIAKRRQARAA